MAQVCFYYDLVSKIKKKIVSFFGTWSKASRLMRDLNARKIVHSN